MHGMNSTDGTDVADPCTRHGDWADRAGGHDKAGLMAVPTAARGRCSRHDGRIWERWPGGGGWVAGGRAGGGWVAEHQQLVVMGGGEM